MKKVIFKTALALVLAAVLVTGFAVSSFAVSNELAGTWMLYTYYDVRDTASGGLGLTDNYFTATNIATDRWLQAHVRIRTGHHSIELLDFDVLLSPTDVFTFDLYEDNGAMVFASCDSKTLQNSGFVLNFDRNADGTNDCFVLDSNTFPAMLSLVKTCEVGISDAEALNHVKKGYVEFLQEGVVWALNSYSSSASKDLCQGPDGQSTANGGAAGTDADNVSIANKLLDHTTSSLDLVNVCPADYDDPYEILIGRQYYVEVRNGVVARMGHLNSEIIDDENSALVEHKESFAAESTDGDCSAADSGPCYAYVAPAIGDTVANGADDLNYCLYKAKITNTNDVANKFGAGATFGPTLADIQEDDQRDGSLFDFSNSTLEYLMGYCREATEAYNMGSGGSDGYKQYAVSHYFASPAPGVYDINTAFAFTFPVQHFIGELDKITLKAIYDNEENTTTVVLGKFLSPGLPTSPVLQEEASLQTLSGAPFAEGWVRFEVSATNSTTGCTETNTDLTNCEVTPFGGNTPTDPYVPCYTAAVFTTGADHIGASHFQYSNDQNEDD